MSAYRSYAPWNHHVSRSYSSEKKAENSSGLSKYESASYSKSRPDAKKSEDRSLASLTNKYTSTNTASHRPTETTSRLSDSRNDLRMKESHPPVTYRPIVRTTTGSRDPSPIKSYPDYNRLYVPQYGRERKDSVSSTSSTIPKYVGRTSLTSDDGKSYNLGRSSRNSSTENLSIPKYQPTESKTDLLTARFKSRADDSKFKYNASSSKDKFIKTPSRASSREDLSKGSQRFITSRFLPKNTIEKSHTAYVRPSSIRSNEVSRKNRELLNSLSNSSRSVSRCSSVAPEEVSEISSGSVSEHKDPEEFETVSMVTRSTSPNLSSSETNLRNRFLETKRRPKKRPELTDKAVQTDRSDDSSASSKFSGSRISTPWSTFLDMKFSSPESSSKEDGDKKLSRNSSKKSISSQSSSKSDLSKSKSNSSPSSSDKDSNKIKSKHKSIVKLPPSTSESSHSLHGLNTPNKDFRKSVLNMNPEVFNKKSSPESTEFAEKSKLPQRIPREKLIRDRRSPSSSSDTSSSTSKSVTDESQKSIKSAQPSSNDKNKSDKDIEAKSFLMRALAPVTNFFKRQENNERSLDTFSDSNTEKGIPDLPKSTSLSKSSIRRIQSGDNSWWFLDNGEEYISPKGKLKLLKHVESGERAWWLDENSEIPEGVEVYPAKSVGEDGVTEDGKLIYKIRSSSDYLDSSEATDRNISELTSDESKSSIKLIERLDSGQKSWWLEERDERGFRQLRHVESGEQAWWLSNTTEVPEGIEVYPCTSTNEKGYTEEGRIIYKIRKSDSQDTEWWLTSSESHQEEPEFLQRHKIRHIDSGERAWWMSSSENINNEVEENASCIWPNDYDPTVLGDRASPEGLETPSDQLGRLSPYDNVPYVNQNQLKHQLFQDSEHFISRHTNIDEILGGSSQLFSPMMDMFYTTDSEDIEPLGMKNILQKRNPKGPEASGYQSSNSLDDAALQLYKDGDYGSYLDLDASIAEQQEEFDGFHNNKKNSIVLRTQLSVRVHTIIEKLLNSEGRELRRALFSLKQIFQEDKDLVHEFVQNDGLACLIKVGSEADQNYQNYILRALGQVMLYVDGMNGVMEHNETVQWLYTLISSKFRLVVKTALKLLLVFVEYTDSNCLLLIKAIQATDAGQGLLSWHNVMKLLKDFDSADTELLIYATTLINKCLNGIPDQDTYYDQTDALEEQGIEAIIRRYMSKPGTDLDLLQQFQIYEAVLQYEDGEDKNTPIRHLDETIRKTLRSRKSLVGSAERRKSRRHSTGNTPTNLNNAKKKLPLQENNEDDDESSSSQSSNGFNHQNLNGCYKETFKANDAGVTPALRRRRERTERQRSFMKEQQENATLIRGVITKSDENSLHQNGNYTNGLQQRLANNALNRNGSRKDLTPYLNAVNKLDSEENGITKQPWIMYNDTEQNQENIEENGGENGIENDRKMLLQLKKENTVKDLTQKLASQNIVHSQSSEESKSNRIEGMTGLISKAKEGLAKSKSQAQINVPASKPVEVKKSENELRWEELVANISRPLNLCDMDFTDLGSEDETDVLAPVCVTNGIPPPPPPPRAGIPPPVPNPPMYLQKVATKANETKIPVKKNKKTVKLFWKEVRDDPLHTSRSKSPGYIWDELSPVAIDTQKLEHLFESRAKDLINKKQQEINKNKEIIVLDPKRSNAINIGMTKLPPPRSIKTAILKMDATIMNREGIEKLLTMLPTEEERTKIQEAQASNPEIPLGSAEQFLLTLASISELPARLKLWAFKLDFENIEREIAEPLMDLKQGLEVLRVNKTFRGILGTLLSIGNFLNGNEVKGFQIEYLAKVPEVKDTVHKHSLLHHLCHIVMEKFPDATDLYSEIGAITRASKVDFDELASNVQKLESDCKASWDHLKLIAKHDGSTMKSKMSDFLADCAERIIILSIVCRRVINRYHRFLLWLGIPMTQIAETKPSEFCRIVSEFALEYRTTRERVLQQLEKKANHRERNKTRGKMITETAKFRSKEDRADAELRQLLGNDLSDMESLQGTLPWRRTKKDSNRSLMSKLNGHLTDGDDEILESLVKTATKAPTTRTAPRERKRTRHADRKSLRRTLKNGLSEEEKLHLSAVIKGYSFAS